MRTDPQQTCTTRRPRRRRRALVGGGLLLVGLMGAMGGGAFINRRLSVPPTLLMRRDVNSLRIQDSNGGVLRQEFSQGGTRQTWVTLNRISPHLIRATVASEDHRFYRHTGVDWTAIMRSIGLNAKAGRWAFGGSTITMQLARLVTDIPRTVTGKLKQILMAQRLEYHLDKDAILEEYLNRVYYGNGAWGAQQAATLYFGKSADALSISEASLLAVLPRGPVYYDPFRYPKRVTRRQRHILQMMVQQGVLAPKDMRAAIAAPLVPTHHDASFAAPHFVQYAKDQLPRSYRRGARVTTTIDIALQHMMEQAVTRHVNTLRWKQLTQAALVVLRNSDGAILAMVGSADWFDHSRNGAFNGTTARLRPGSTLKPFVYGAAMEQGDTPATIAMDVVLPRDQGQFYTRDVRSHGFARYREALAGSYNLSAVHTLQRVGIGTVLQKLRTAGLRTLDDPDERYDWGLAIGHADARLIDLTAAFSTFGTGGVPVTPYAIRFAELPTGHTWRETPLPRPRVFSREISYLIFDILSDPDARRPMFGQSVPMSLPFQVALKTGTTRAFTDLWALGTTREFTVGVWAGNFDGAPTHQVRSVHGATPLMRAAFVALASRYGTPSSLTPPVGIVQRDICPVSGKRPGPHCPHRKREWFLRDALPLAPCDWHVRVQGRTVVQYPPELRGWAEVVSQPMPPSEAQSAPTTPPTTPSPSAALDILYPPNGARFVLEPHRPADLQRPPVRSTFVSDTVEWTVNGIPFEDWIPTPGEHHIVARSGARQDAVTIRYDN